MTLRKRPFIWNGLLLTLALVISIGIGPVNIAPGTLLRILVEQIPGNSVVADWPASFPAIVLQIRVPHTLLMIITGSALAGSGAAYQGVFRNPLADPFVIGVASGAGLGAVYALVVDWPTDWLGLYTIPAAAFAGAVLTVMIVYSLSRLGRSLPTITLILAGVAVSSFATALTSYLMLQSEEELRRAISWMLGGGILGGWPPVVAALPYVLLGLIILVLSGHPLNVLQYGDEQAQQLGLNVSRARTIIVAGASLATAAAVAFTGIIGFIGLIVPHIVRLIWGPDHRRLIPISIMAGATLLLMADTLARVVVQPQVLPVGIVTALAGAPFFLWILRRERMELY